MSADFQTLLQSLSGAVRAPSARSLVLIVESDATQAQLFSEWMPGPVETQVCRTVDDVRVLLRTVSPDLFFVSRFRDVALTDGVEGLHELNNSLPMVILADASEVFSVRGALPAGLLVRVLERPAVRREIEAAVSEVMVETALRRDFTRLTEAWNALETERDEFRRRALELTERLERAAMCVLTARRPIQVLGQLKTQLPELTALSAITSQLQGPDELLRRRRIGLEALHSVCETVDSVQLDECRGGLLARRKRVRIDRFVEQVAEAWTKDPARQKTTLRIVPNAQVGSALLDDALLGPAVLELLRNAAEAASQTTIDIEYEGGSDDFIVLKVRDQAIGMPEEVVKRAAEPFFSTKPGRPGLGLFFVTSVARVHGGRCRIDSRPGAGTTVYIEFPREPGSPI